MKDMQVKSKTVVWTAGTKINSAYQSISGVQLTDRKRVKVNEFLALGNDNHIFVIGDGAGTPYSGLAQTAIWDGKYIGRHISFLIRGRKSFPYKPKRTSYVIAIGNEWALLVWRNFVFKGVIPWLLRSIVDIRYLASIVPFGYVISILRQGAKYRRSKTYCPIE